MTRMADEQAELAELRAITRPRLLTSVYDDLRETYVTMVAVAESPRDVREAAGLGVLLDMYDKLKARDA